MPIALLKQSTASVATPGAGKVAVYVDSASGEPSYKDDTGASRSLATQTQVTALSIVSGVVNIDLAGGALRDFTLALTANITSITFSNMPGAGYVAEFELQITQDATGGRTVAWPASFKALGNSDTTVSPAANAVTVLSAKTFDQGTTWRYGMQESA